MATSREVATALARIQKAQANMMRELREPSKRLNSHLLDKYHTELQLAINSYNLLMLAHTAPSSGESRALPAGGSEAI